MLVALKPDAFVHFAWPRVERTPPTVGERIGALMAEGGWSGAESWALQANSIGPTLVGGSRKHGGPDLGPTRARAAWLRLGVDGRSLADAPPAAVQGFPDQWQFSGRKTSAYRQVGNAFPPPVAEAVGAAIREALEAAAAQRTSPRLRIVS